MRMIKQTDHDAFGEIRVMENELTGVGLANYLIFLRGEVHMKCLEDWVEMIMPRDLLHFLSLVSI